MRLKIRCDEKCEKFCKIFWEVNKAMQKRKEARPVLNGDGVFLALER